MADDLGFQPTASQGQDLGFQPAPQVPDMSGMQKTVQRNLTPEAPKEGAEPEENPPQSPAQRLDTGMGFSASSTLKGGNQDTPLPTEIRGHLVNAYKDGSAQTSGDFFQSALMAASPVLQVGEAAQSIGARTVGTLAYPFLSPENRQKLIENGVLGSIPTLTGDSTHDLIAKTLTRANALLSPGTGLAYALPASLASPIINPTLEAANKAAGVGEGSNVPAAEELVMNVFGLGGGKFVWDRVHGADTMKQIVGEHLGKSPEAVTSADIDNTIHEGFKNIGPKASDFENVSKIMTNDNSHVDALHNIYEQTGVRPDQVYEDAQHNPEVMAAINENRIPTLYDHLIDRRPAIPADIQEALNRKWETPEERPTVTSKEYSKTLYNNLHEKLGQDTATDIQSMQRELTAKDALGKDLDEKFYLKKEDENIKLTPDEQKLYDQYIKPLGEQERALYEKARALGAEEVEPVSESYVHRIVKGKGHYLDKYETEFGEDENIGLGTPRRSLSQTTSGLEEAKFHALQDAEGNRKLQTGEIPQGYKAGDKYTDENGKEWTVKRAKTEEIEANTDLKYYKSAIGNTEANIRQLDKTVRNIEFLNGLKNDVKESGLGIPPGEKGYPRDFQQVNIPQLRGWSFDPRVAEVLNDIYDRGGDSMLGRINNILIKGMFLNPIPHAENVFYDYLASRGWKNLQGIKGANYVAEGIKDVKEFSPEYLDVLKRGGALRLPAIWKTEFFNQIEREALKELQQSKEGLELAKSWGFDTVPALAEKVFNTSQKALWGSGDAFLMAKIRELKDGGLSTNEAIKEAQKHIIDYRIPPRVGEEIVGPQLSRMLSKALQNNAIVVFTRYHYGLFKALGNSIKDLVGGTKEMDAAKASEAAGQLFATYFLLTVVNPAIASMWSSITGQKEKVRNPGVTGLMGAILDFAIGKKSLGEALKTQFIVSPGIQVGSDILNDKIIDSRLGHEGVQLMDYLMKQPTMAIPSIPYNIREGRESMSEEALRQIGVTPNKEYKKKRPSTTVQRKLEKEEEELMGHETP